MKRASWIPTKTVANAPEQTHAAAAQRRDNELPRKTFLVAEIKGRNFQEDTALAFTGLRSKRRQVRSRAANLFRTRTFDNTRASPIFNPSAMRCVGAYPKRHAALLMSALTVAHVASTKIAVAGSGVLKMRKDRRKQPAQFGIKIVQRRAIADRNIIRFVDRLGILRCRCQQIRLYGVST